MSINLFPPLSTCLVAPFFHWTRQSSANGIFITLYQVFQAPNQRTLGPPPIRVNTLDTSPLNFTCIFLSVRKLIDRGTRDTLAKSWINFCIVIVGSWLSKVGYQSLQTCLDGCTVTSSHFPQISQYIKSWSPTRPRTIQKVCGGWGRCVNLF